MCVYCVCKKIWSHYGRTMILLSTKGKLFDGSTILQKNTFNVLFILYIRLSLEQTLPLHYAPG